MRARPTHAGLAAAIALAACASRPASRDCAAGLVVLDGACVSPRAAAAYCGGPCGPLACDDGEARDLRRHACLPARAVRALASRERPVPESAHLVCRDGSALVADGDRVACLPLASTCPRTATWDEPRAACVPLLPCPPGSVRGPSGCVDLVGEGRVVDVGRWARATLGPDGGAGSSRVCAPLAASPWTFEVASGGSRQIALSIELVFADNDVTLVSSRVTGPDVPSAGLALADAAVASLLPALRALGGTTDAASVTTRVTCLVRGGSSPLVLQTP